MLIPPATFLRSCHKMCISDIVMNFQPTLTKKCLFISTDILIHFDPFSSTRWHHLHLCLSWSDLVYLCLSWSVSYHHRVALNAHQVLKVRWIGLDGPMNASLLITVTGFQSSQVPLSISQKAKLEQLVWKCAESSAKDNPQVLAQNLYHPVPLQNLQNICRKRLRGLALC